MSRNCQKLILAFLLLFFILSVIVSFIVVRVVDLNKSKNPDFKSTTQMDKSLTANEISGSSNTTATKLITTTATITTKASYVIFTDLSTVTNSVTPPSTTSSSCQESQGSEFFIGDTLCDGVNNIPECEFDGGDCCRDCINKEYCGIDYDQDEESCFCKVNGFEHPECGNKTLHKQSNFCIQTLL